MKIEQPSVEDLLVSIQKIWLTKVRADADDARLWNNEEAVAASLYHHLRNDVLDRFLKWRRRLESS